HEQREQERDGRGQPPGRNHASAEGPPQDRQDHRNLHEPRQQHHREGHHHQQPQPRRQLGPLHRTTRRQASAHGPAAGSPADSAPGPPAPTPASPPPPPPPARPSPATSPRSPARRPSSASRSRTFIARARPPPRSPRSARSAPTHKSASTAVVLTR